MFEKKITKAVEIINNTLSTAKNPFVVFRGDNYSLVTLHLVKCAYTKPVNVLFIDTTAHFNEIYLFVEKMRRLWGFNLKMEKNEESLKSLKIAEDKARCCLELKLKVFENAIKKFEIDCVFMGNRGDGGEEYVSLIEDQMRINPIWDFTESEVWEYIKKYNLPFCSLYEKGYKIIDCIPCIKPEGTDECSDRLEDREIVINRLRSLGYF